MFPTGPDTRVCRDCDLQRPKTSWREREREREGEREGGREGEREGGRELIAYSTSFSSCTTQKKRIAGRGACSYLHNTHAPRRACLRASERSTHTAKDQGTQSHRRWTQRAPTYSSHLASPPNPEPPLLASSCAASRRQRPLYFILYTLLGAAPLAPHLPPRRLPLPLPAAAPSLTRTPRRPPPSRRPRASLPPAAA